MRKSRLVPVRLASLFAVCLLAELVAGCAAVHESRTRDVLSDESVRLAERPRPALDVVEVEPKLAGSLLTLRIARVQRCVVDFAERKVVREHVEVEPSKSVLAAEVVVLGTGIGGAVWALERDKQSESGAAISGGTLEVMSVVAVLAAGTALIIDGSKSEDRTSVSSTLSGVQAQRVVSCTRQSARVWRVELRTSSGRRLLATVDPQGRASIRVPDDVWVDARLDGDLYVDGRVVRRIVLRRAP